jgi:parvulin-like peptidyl-prolyl isomerase
MRNTIVRTLLTLGLLAAWSIPAAPRAAARQATPAAQQPTRTIVQRILVKVNGEPFTQTDLVQRQAEVLRQERQIRTTPRDIQTDAALAAVLVEITPKIILDVVDELLMLQRGRELGIKFTDETFKQVLDNLKSNFKLDDAGLRAGLAQEGFTLESYRAIAERQHIINQVQKNELNISLTSEEARQYYNKHKDEFMAPANVTIRELTIVVPTLMQDGKPVFSAGADDEAKAKITGIRERVLKGEDFAKLVTELSESPSKASGGLITGLKLADVGETLRTAIEKQPQGGVTEPIRMSTGYSIFKIEEKLAAQPQPFEAVKNEISNRIFAERADAETLKYVDKLRAQALIEWKDEALKRAYEKALAERATAGK